MLAIPVDVIAVLPERHILSDGRSVLTSFRPHKKPLHNGTRIILLCCYVTALMFQSSDGAISIVFAHLSITFLYFAVSPFYKGFHYIMCIVVVKGYNNLGVSPYVGL